VADVALQQRERVRVGLVTVMLLSGPFARNPSDFVPRAIASFGGDPEFVGMIRVVSGVRGQREDLAMRAGFGARAPVCAHGSSKVAEWSCVRAL
jgi:hypothetical protein